MTHVLANLVAQASSYTGTAGVVPLDGATALNHQSFGDALADGSTVRVAVFDKATGDSEIMVATYATAGPSLTRTSTVLALGPNATTPTTPCDFQAGPKEVHLVRDAAQDSVTPGAGLTPRALASGKIADGWLGTVAVVATNTFDVDLSAGASRIQTRAADGAVTIGGTGYAANVDATVVVKNTTGAPIAISVTAAWAWIGPVLTEIAAGATLTIALLSTGTTAGDTQAAMDIGVPV